MKTQHTSNLSSVKVQSTEIKSLPEVGRVRIRRKQRRIGRKVLNRIVRKIQKDSYSFAGPSAKRKSMGSKRAGERGRERAIQRSG